MPLLLRLEHGKSAPKDYLGWSSKINFVKPRAPMIPSPSNIYSRVINPTTYASQALHPLGNPNALGTSKMAARHVPSTPWRNWALDPSAHPGPAGSAVVVGWFAKHCRTGPQFHKPIFISMMSNVGKTLTNNYIIISKLYTYTLNKDWMGSPQQGSILDDPLRRRSKAQVDRTWRWSNLWSVPLWVVCLMGLFWWKVSEP